MAHEPNGAAGHESYEDVQERHRIQEEKDRQCRGLLDKHRVEMVKCIAWEGVMDYMIGDPHGLEAVCDQTERIQKANNDCESRRALIAAVRSRGFDTFRLFVKALVGSNKGMATKLASEIDVLLNLDPPLMRDVEEMLPVSASSSAQRVAARDHAMVSVQDTRASASPEPGATVVTVHGDVPASLANRPARPLLAGRPLAEELSSSATIVSVEESEQTLRGRSTVGAAGDALAVPESQPYQCTDVEEEATLISPVCETAPPNIEQIVPGNGDGENLPNRFQSAAYRQPGEANASNEPRMRTPGEEVASGTGGRSSGEAPANAGHRRHGQASAQAHEGRGRDALPVAVACSVGVLCCVAMVPPDRLPYLAVISACGALYFAVVRWDM